MERDYIPRCIHKSRPFSQPFAIFKGFLLPFMSNKTLKMKHGRQNVSTQKRLYVVGTSTASTVYDL